MRVGCNVILMWVKSYVERGCAVCRALLWLYDAFCSTLSMDSLMILFTSSATKEACGGWRGGRGVYSFSGWARDVEGDKNLLPFG